MVYKNGLYKCEAFIQAIKKKYILNYNARSAKESILNGNNPFGHDINSVGIHLLSYLWSTDN